MPHTSGGRQEIYALFDRTGLLKLLDEDYRVLHGMSMDTCAVF